MPISELLQAPGKRSGLYSLDQAQNDGEWGFQTV